MKYNALSLIEPWLQLIINGKKTVEFRTWWRPEMVGQELLLCSSKRKLAKGTVETMKELFFADELDILAAERWLGHARCLVKIKRILPATPARYGMQPGFSFHDDGKTTWAWELKNVRPIEPFPVKGKLGIYQVEVEDELKFRV